jgi:hypothetical protein
MASPIMMVTTAQLLKASAAKGDVWRINNRRHLLARKHHERKPEQ